MGSHIQHVRSKRLKTTVLLKNNHLRGYIPETVNLSRKNLMTMLEKHSMVYVKPDKGRYGNGVMKIERIEDQKGYSLHYGTKIIYYPSYMKLYRKVAKRVNVKEYIVQKGIKMLTHQGKPFDIRVMVQLSPNKTWVTTGLLARVGGPKRAVTNYHNGGTPTQVAPLLASYLSKEEIKALLNRLTNLGVKAAKHCHKYFPGLKEIGLDVALDNQFTPWILEVNTRPDPFVFRALKDKTMFKRIYHFAKCYGKY